MPVTILAGIQIFLAILFGALGAVALLDPEAALPSVSDLAAASGGPGAAAVAAGAALLFGGLAGVQLLAGIALLQLRQLGWTLAMLMAGVSLASQIVTWWTSGEVLAISMLLSVVTVLYLNQGQVREAFGLAGGRVTDLEAERG
ncbi:MAG: hypothetical protein MUQ32_04900 [Chloroflexi bacterium]|nr:hypothetical protein [Chloroflexota bacterium]